MPSLVNLLEAAGIAGAVLVVADNEAIARGGPAWAEQLAGRVHRVRLAPAASPAAAAALVAEARSLGATAIVAAGGDEPRRIAAEAARLLGVALIDLGPGAARNDG